MSQFERILLNRYSSNAAGLASLASLFQQQLVRSTAALFSLVGCGLLSYFWRIVARRRVQRCDALTPL
jgi:hypothetical protein